MNDFMQLLETKLERNGYVQKVTDLADKKRVQVYLTARGQIAFQAHEEFHRGHNDIYEYLEGLTEKEQEVVSCFLRKTQQMINHHF